MTAAFVHKRRLTLSAALVAVLALLAFSVVVRFGFVFDDVWTIQKNDALGRPLAALLRSALAGTAHAHGIVDATRPTMIASLWLDRRLFGVAPAGFHLHSLALYALVTAEACLAVFALTRRLRAALAGGVAFALWPAHAEVVASVNYREDLLAAGAVIGVIAWLTWPRRAPTSGLVELLVVALFAVGLFAKESAVALLPVGIAAGAILRPGVAARRRHERAVVSLLAVLVLWLSWRWALTFGGDDVPRAASAGVASALLDTARFEVRALLSVLAPIPGAPVYAVEAHAGAGWLVALGLVLLLLIALARRRATRPLALGAAIALLAPLGASPLVGPINARADRYFFLGMLGGAVIWGTVADRLSRAMSKRLRIAALALASVTLGGLALGATLPWSSERALWTYAVQRQPASPRAWAALSRVQRLSGDLDAADVSAARAIDLAPDYAPAHVTRAYNALARGDTASASIALSTVEALGGGAAPGVKRARQCAVLSPDQARTCVGASP